MRDSRRSGERYTCEKVALGTRIIDSNDSHLSTAAIGVEKITFSMSDRPSPHRGKDASSGSEDYHTPPRAAKDE